MPSFSDHPTTRWAIHFLALCALVFALRYGQLMIMPVIVSLMLATALWPTVSYLHGHWHLPRAIAGLIVILSVVTVAGLFVAWTAFKMQEVYLQLPPVQSWFAPPPSAPDGAEEATPSLPWENPYAQLHKRIRSLFNEEAANNVVPKDPRESILFRNFAPLLTDQLNAIPQYAGTAIEQTLFISFLVLFLLVEGDMLMRRTIDVFGPTTGAGSQGAIRALQNMARQVRAYLLWRTFLNVGLALTLGFLYKYFFGMSFPWIWAILAGVLTYIPYLGPIVAGIPAILDALISPAGGPFAAMGVMLVLVIVFTLEGYLVFPLVVGRNMEMNATTTLLACLFWWLVWGNIGLFLAMPLTGAIRAICQNVPGWEPWANLMSMDSRPPNPRSWLMRRIDAMLGQKRMASTGAALGTASVNGEVEVENKHVPTQPEKN